MLNKAVDRMLGKAAALALLSVLALSLLNCGNRAPAREPEPTPDQATPSHVIFDQPSPEETDADKGSSYTAKGIDAKVGLVSLMNDGNGCVRALNASLRSGDEIHLITPYAGEVEIAKIRIIEKVAMSCVDDDSDIGDGETITELTSYYLAEMVKAASEYQMLSGFVILDPAVSPTVEKGIATAELTESPPAEYFRECTSNEGMHFTVWTGKPLVGKRIWHRYWYLHYDTEFTCKKKDYEY